MIEQATETNYILSPYDEALAYILKHGERRNNRTGVPTLSVFGLERRYRIDQQFPIVTGRKLRPESIFAELLWFLSGSTLDSDLQKLGAKIWSRWQSEEFESKHGYVKSALGPVYGFQLRHFGGKYGDGDPQNPAYGEGGFDQLLNMVNMLRRDPTSRRNLFSLWNPRDIEVSRLPPCHYTFQVYVSENKLSGKLVQRSADFGVGVPANIQFYSALIYMLALQTGLVPYEFVHSTSDSHIYIDQIKGVEEYLARSRPPSPQLRLHVAPSITEYQLANFELIDYHPLPKIDIPVAV